MDINYSDIKKYLVATEISVSKAVFLIKKKYILKISNKWSLRLVTIPSSGRGSSGWREVSLGR